MRATGVLVLSAMLQSALFTAVHAETYRLYIGTYSEPEKGGIFQATFDEHTGKLSDATLAAPTTKPSFLALHPTNKFLYAVGEISEFQGKPGGGVSAFSVDAATGKLTLLNEESSQGAIPCHIVLDQAGTTALVANYTGGNVTAFPVEADGRLKPASSLMQHHGGTPNSARQKAPHAHSINLDAANKRAFAADLGLDKILIYDFDPEKHTLAVHEPAAAELPPGSGPRHFSFHPNGRFAYVINELANTMAVFQYDAASGKLTPIQIISTLPEGFTQTSYTSEVVVHPTGKFVYGSNRGHDSLAVFAVNPDTGKLTTVGQVRTGGKTPRNFNVSPSGKWVLVGNQGTDNITVFKVDPDSGMLTSTGQSITVPTPVCLRFMPLAK